MVQGGGTKVESAGCYPFSSGSATVTAVSSQSKMDCSGSLDRNTPRGFAVQFVGLDFDPRLNCTLKVYRNKIMVRPMDTVRYSATRAGQFCSHATI